MYQIQFPPWLFEGKPRQGKKVDELNWLWYLTGSWKSHHRKNLISSMSLCNPKIKETSNIGNIFYGILPLHKHSVVVLTRFVLKSPSFGYSYSTRNIFNKICTQKVGKSYSIVEVFTPCAGREAFDSVEPLHGWNC